MLAMLLLPPMFLLLGQLQWVGLTTTLVEHDVTIYKLPLSLFLRLDKQAHWYHKLKLAGMLLTYMPMVHIYWGLRVVAST